MDRRDKGATSTDTTVKEQLTKKQSEEQLTGNEQERRHLQEQSCITFRELLCVSQSKAGSSESSACLFSECCSVCRCVEPAAPTVCTVTYNNSGLHEVCVAAPPQILHSYMHCM